MVVIKKLGTRKISQNFEGNLTKSFLISFDLQRIIQLVFFIIVVSTKLRIHVTQTYFSPKINCLKYQPCE